MIHKLHFPKFIINCVLNSNTDDLVDLLDRLSSSGEMSDDDARKIWDEIQIIKKNIKFIIPSRS